MIFGLHSLFPEKVGCFKTSLTSALEGRKIRTDELFLFIYLFIYLFWSLLERGFRVVASDR